MSTVQHEAIGRLLYIWLANLDWSKSSQSNAFCMNWEHCLAWAQESANQSCLDKFCQENKFSRVGAGYHYQWSLGRVWHDEGQYDDWSWWSWRQTIRRGGNQNENENLINSRIGRRFLIKTSPKRVFLINRWRLFCLHHRSKIPQTMPRESWKWAIISENITRSVNGLMSSFDSGIKRQM